MFLNHVFPTATTTIALTLNLILAHLTDIAANGKYSQLCGCIQPLRRWRTGDSAFAEAYHYRETSRMSPAPLFGQR